MNPAQVCYYFFSCLSGSVSVQVQSAPRDALEDIFVFDVHSNGAATRSDGALRSHGRLRIRQRPFK